MASRRPNLRLWLLTLGGLLPFVAAVACAAAPNSPAQTRPAPGPSAPARATEAPRAPALEVVPTRRDAIVETIFGEQVPDPYRWLEDARAPEVGAWVRAQNDRTRQALDPLGVLPALRERLRALIDLGAVWLPAVRKDTAGNLRLYYKRRTGAQNQPVLLWRESPERPDRVLLDVNALDPDGTTALDYFEPSPNGDLVAYGISRDGSEDSTLYVRDVASGKDLGDTIERTRYASVCWHPDGRGFYYSRYPALGSVPEDEEQYYRRIFEHRLGTDPKSDPLVFGSDRPLTDYPSCALSPNGRWLVVSVHVGWNQTDVFLADTRVRPLRFLEITDRKPQTYGVVVRNDALYIHTNEGAPRYALYRTSPNAPARRNWKLILPEHPRDVLDQFEVLGDRLLAAYSESTIARLERFDLAGKSLGNVPLESLGSISGISGVHDVPQAFYEFESFLTPATTHQLDLGTAHDTRRLTVPLPIDPREYRVTQQRATSKDGTAIPYTLVYRRDANLSSGKNPTLLYGYGGFNVSLTPTFSRAVYPFLERGGVYVQANLRGGGEFGEAWHRAGQLGQKQNVFDDFYAVARALVDTQVTTPERLAIYGRSNGGLLTAAAITQHPEMYRAAVSVVPLTDMVRYPRFLLAQLWTPEYGSPAEPEAFKWLYAYSPYHRVAAGTAYPATLFMTAASDTRVDPAHARKMTAMLQAANASPYPILLRTEEKAGHGAGKPMFKVIDEYADMYAFVLWQLGMLSQPSRAVDPSAGRGLETAGSTE